jgi:omega-6 fatty acid desaturase (delta-12 desaturase)
MTDYIVSKMAAGTQPDLKQVTKKYEQPNLLKASWQLANTFTPYIILCILMYYIFKTGYSYWIILGLAIVAGGLLVRIFIFFHDCAHQSFFTSRKANTVLGYICGILTFTPYEEWRRSHGRHHNTSGDLDRRGQGDVWTLTAEEFRRASKPKRFWYRFFRNPFVLLCLGPAFLFLVSYRYPHKGSKRRQRNSVIFTNAAIAIIIVAASLTIGFKAYALIQFPAIFFAGVIGVWLFYIQHQFEGVYWSRHDQWDPVIASLHGSSYYKLPKVIQWFTGNIGLHHIHHLRSRIPNYNLQRAYDDTKAYLDVEPLTICKSIACLRLKLWDEKGQKLVGFKSASNFISGANK